jgi:hypothetical protein
LQVVAADRRVAVADGSKAVGSLGPAVVQHIEDTVAADGMEAAALVGAWMALVEVVLSDLPR